MYIFLYFYLHFVMNNTVNKQNVLQIDELVLS